MSSPAARGEIAVADQGAHFTRRKLIDWAVRLALFACAAFSVFITFGIAYLLISESLLFFSHVSVVAFLTDTVWTPLFANAHYGILPLLSGTLTIAAIALLVAIPCGTIVAIYLSEFARPTVRNVFKPILEVLAGVPTVVFGYFALLFVTPMLQVVIPYLPGFNMLSAGLVIGIMIIPYIASVSEDAMRAVPNYMREGSLAMGASNWQTAVKVVVPGAFSGITSAYILGMSRAIGETMVVAIAAGLQAKFTFNPTESASTITAYIVSVALGDVPHGSIGYQTIFAAGLTLFVITLLFNLLGHFLNRRLREAY